MFGIHDFIYLVNDGHLFPWIYISLTFAIMYVGRIKMTLIIEPWSTNAQVLKIPMIS